MTKIAKATPFEGKPAIHVPSVYGASTGKDFMYKIPVTGKRPIKITAENLPEGAEINNGIIYGNIKIDCKFTVTVTAENEHGRDVKEIEFTIAPDSILLTPLMGFTSWNAFGSAVSQKDIEDTAAHILDKGISEYGYNYINTDSGWQKEYGGKFDAVMPNEKFPDMKNMCDILHSKGFKCGIYSTPMLTAWGCPDEFESIPGCTRGEPEIWWSRKNGGIGKERCESNNVKQWDEWGFDYLKYDWGPTDAYNAHLMKKELLNAKRDYGFCVTVFACVEYGNYWKEYCNSWRANEDSFSNWGNVSRRLDTVDIWKDYVSPGHFFDLDMLEIGDLYPHETNSVLTEDEELFSYTMRAFFASPIQLSCKIDKLTEFEFNMICNDEIIAINQDSLADFPELISTFGKGKAYRRNLENGDIAIAVFNTNDEILTDSIMLDKTSHIRDVWAKEDAGCSDELKFIIPPHSVKVYRIKYN